MANQPHDKTGKKCSECGRVFDKKSMSCTLTRKEKGFIVHRLVCSDCKIDYQKGL